MVEADDSVNTPQTGQTTVYERMQDKIRILLEEFEEIMFLKRMADELRSLRDRLVVEKYD